MKQMSNNTLNRSCADIISYLIHKIGIMVDRQRDTLTR